MATARPFAYNTGSPIPGTEQIGDLSIGAPLFFDVQLNSVS